MLIQEVVNAMRMRLTTDAITQSIYVSPGVAGGGAARLWVATDDS